MIHYNLYGDYKKFDFSVNLWYNIYIKSEAIGSTQ